MKNYFYIDANNSQQGPVPAERLKDYGVTKSTMVWAEGMANWTEAGQVEDLTPLFAPPAAPFTPQPQPQPQPQYGQQQPQPQSQPQGMGKPDSNLIWALLCTFFCCQILGIIAIVKACEVDGKWNSGDYAGAIASSESAKKWSMWGAISGVVFWVLYVIIYVGLIAAGALSSSF